LKIPLGQGGRASFEGNQGFEPRGHDQPMQDLQSLGEQLQPIGNLAGLGPVGGPACRLHSLRCLELRLDLSDPLDEGRDVGLAEEFLDLIEYLRPDRSFVFSSGRSAGRL
jgi:hypothetical protein